MAKLDWTPGPVAHRGWHDAASGIVENTPRAFERALASGLAIEIDVQAAADDQPVVFHDFELERLTHGQGPVRALTPDALSRLDMLGTSDRIMDLNGFLDLVAGRVPVLIEVKTDWSAPGQYEREIARAIDGYRGALGLMSFDPRSVAALRQLCPLRPVGLVAGTARGDKPDPDSKAGPSTAFKVRALLAMPRMRLDFLAYNVKCLPSRTTELARHFFKLPVFTWTVRSPAERAAARAYADAPIFEGPVPDRH